MDHFVGVDGCKSGWFAVWQESRKFQAAIYPNINELWRTHRHAQKILIDIPIGLKEVEPRQLEATVRRLLGSRRSSVFSVPCQKAAYATEYSEANAINRRYFDKGLSKQAYYICPKIVEVDRLLAYDKRARLVFGECHPELAFATHHGEPMIENKKSAAGVEQRLSVLSQLGDHYSDRIKRWLETFPRKSLLIDDCLDASILFETAKCCTTLKTSPEKGMGGIDIHMWVPDIRGSII